MVNKTTNLMTQLATSYALKIHRTGVNGKIIEKTITSFEMNELTPRGRPIVASRKDVLAVLRQFAKSIKRQSSPVLEVSGAARVRTVK